MNEKNKIGELMQKNFDEYDSFYFIGMGGIGMSNLARYFHSKSKRVGGYDRTKTSLTEALAEEEIFVHYEDNIEEIPAEFKDKESTLIIFTPAVTQSHSELSYFREEGFVMMKRAQVLGEISRQGKAVCIAGTHGKTTVSSMTAHLLRQSHVDCNAFLGGILKNYGTNLLLSDKSDIIVAEADEYDRSFHWLSPWIAVITSVSPDHLDIYGTTEAYHKSFEKFTSLVCKNGYLIVKKELPITLRCDKSVKIYTYSEKEGDFHAENLRIGHGEIVFDFVAPDYKIKGINIGVPVSINIENAVAAIASAKLCGAQPDEIRSAMASFGGAKRRFEFIIKTPNLVFIDDYAHHPDELTASITSIKKLYPEKKITGIFQPHLYTRTRDFADQFAKCLSLLNEVILLDIYPARELPIEGVTSKIIFDKIACKNKILCNKSDVIDLIDKKDNLEVLVTIGAGDIEQLLNGIKQALEKKLK